MELEIGVWGQWSVHRSQELELEMGVWSWRDELELESGGGDLL